MNELKVFKNEEFGSIRTLEINGEPWFVGKDVAAALGYTDPSSAVSKNVESDDKTTLLLGQAGSNYKSKTTVVSESGLYALIFSSKLESAKMFKRWVTSEVLPSIRKHGAYMTDNVLEQAIANPDFMIGLLQNLKEEQQKRVEAERKRDMLIHQSKLYTTSEIAKELNLKSAIALNKMLADDKVQYKQNGTWLLYSKYADLNLVSVKQQILDNGRVIYDRRWTGTGRDFILNKYSTKTNNRC